MKVDNIPSFFVLQSYLHSLAYINSRKIGINSVCVENYNNTMVSFKVTTLAILAAAITLCSASVSQFL